MTSLLEWASALKPPRKCAICLLPQRPEIDAGLRAGLGRKTILRWLKEEAGVSTITTGNVDHHVKSEHHLEPLNA